MAVQENNQLTRHVEIMGRLEGVDKRVLRVEERMRTLEITEAEFRPILRGGKAVAFMVFAGLIAGYLGSRLPLPIP